MSRLRASVRVAAIMAAHSVRFVRFCVNDLSNLDLVERKHHQLAQRRVPGSEIVQSYRDPEILELPQYRQTFRSRLDEGSFSNFKLEPLRRQSSLGKRTQHDIDKVILSKLHG